MEAARTLADLGELTAQWLEGAIASQPAYTPGCGPDPETTPLIPVLACCNRAGYVTNGSQPGETGTGYDGARWEQRAAVEGFASPAVAERIWEAAGPAGLTVIAHAPATLPRWRIRYDQAVPVTTREARPCTWFGAQLSRHHLRDGWTGYGICHPDAVTALCTAWQVTVIDPGWGRNDRLWPVLLDALTNGADPRQARDPAADSRARRDLVTGFRRLRQRPARRQPDPLRAVRPRAVRLPAVRHPRIPRPGRSAAWPHPWRWCVMGRLDVRIQHGHGGDGTGPWAALAVLVALAVVGGAARPLIGTVVHVLVTVLEVIAWTLAGTASAAVLTGAVLAGIRIRRAVLAAGARRTVAQPAPVIQIRPEGYVRPLPDRASPARPALSPPPQGPATAWPLPGWWKRSGRGSGVTVMSTAPGRRPAQLAPGVEGPALWPGTRDRALIEALSSTPGVEILTGPDGPYPNHRDAGERMYLTVRLSRQDTDVRRAAHSHQAIRRPAAPSRRQLPS